MSVTARESIALNRQDLTNLQAFIDGFNSGLSDPKRVIQSVAQLQLLQGFYRSPGRSTVRKVWRWFNGNPVYSDIAHLHWLGLIDIDWLGRVWPSAAYKADTDDFLMVADRWSEARILAHGTMSIEDSIRYREYARMYDRTAPLSYDEICMLKVMQRRLVLKPWQWLLDYRARRWLYRLAMFDLVTLSPLGTARLGPRFQGSLGQHRLNIALQVLLALCPDNPEAD